MVKGNEGTIENGNDSNPPAAPIHFSGAGVGSIPAKLCLARSPRMFSDIKRPWSGLFWFAAIGGSVRGFAINTFKYILDQTEWKRVLSFLFKSESPNSKGEGS